MQTDNGGQLVSRREESRLLRKFRKQLDRDVQKRLSALWGDWPESPSLPQAKHTPLEIPLCLRAGDMVPALGNVLDTFAAAMDPVNALQAIVAELPDDELITEGSREELCTLLSATDHAAWLDDYFKSLQQPQLARVAAVEVEATVRPTVAVQLLPPPRHTGRVSWLAGLTIGLVITITAALLWLGGV